MSIPQGTPDTTRPSALRSAADEAKSRGCTYFVQSENNGLVSCHRSRRAALEEAYDYGQRTPGMCRATAYRVDEHGPEVLEMTSGEFRDIVRD